MGRARDQGMWLETAGKPRAGQVGGVEDEYKWQAESTCMPHPLPTLANPIHTPKASRSMTRKRMVPSSAMEMPSNASSVSLSTRPPGHQRGARALRVSIGPRVTVTLTLEHADALFDLICPTRSRPCARTRERQPLDPHDTSPRTKEKFPPHRAWFAPPLDSSSESPVPALIHPTSQGANL